MLLVEDDHVVRGAMLRSLADRGHAVHAVGTALDALRRVAAETPDLVVLDLGLPDLDGCSFMTELRSRGDAASATPSLALTVLGRPGEQARITAAGFDVFRQKPIDPMDLAHEVGRLARPARGTRSARPPC